MADLLFSDLQQQRRRRDSSVCLFWSFFYTFLRLLTLLHAYSVVSLLFGPNFSLQFVTLVCQLTLRNAQIFFHFSVKIAIYEAHKSCFLACVFSSTVPILGRKQTKSIMEC